MKRYTAFLVPKPGLLIRDPVSKLIMLATGEIKPLAGPLGKYWKRRLKDGSVIIQDLPKTIKKEKEYTRKTKED